MAKPIIVRHGGHESHFALTRLDRAKLYGRRQRQPLDPEGRRCTRVELTQDGSLMVRSGMTAQAYFDEKNTWIPSSALVGIDAEGNVVDKQPSTLGVPQDLESIEPQELLEFALRTVYSLDPLDLNDALQKELEGGALFKFRFNYRADYHAETAVLLANDSGFFALIGDPIKLPWLSLDQAPQINLDDEDEDDELDFEMF